MPAQLLRIMRLTALLLIVVCMHVNAHGYSQTISFSGKNVPLQAVFASIEKQTGLSFFFNYAVIKNTKLVTLEIQEVPLDEALTTLLKGEGLDFYRTGKTIFIVKASAVKPEPVIFSDDDKQVTIKGRVINQQGEPLAGASVWTKDKKRGTITNERGIFELKNVSSDIVLIISFTGYKRTEILVNGRDAISVELAIADNNLDEAQVIAYGTTTRRLNTGNVSTVKAAELEKQPVSNPLLALEGRVPGMFITQSSGVAGSGVNVLIRGRNSIGQGNDPLYVIDGVPYTSQLLPSLSGIQKASYANSPNVSGNIYGNPLSYINMADIESIDILKDADATAIYGSRAANGAVLITTKKGRLGNGKVEVNAQTGWGKDPFFLKLMNTKQYLEMRHEALKNDGISNPSVADYDINGLWDSTRNTDWQRKLLGGTAQYNDVQASISGGNINLQYLIGSTYHRETTVFPGNFSDQKGSIHFNVGGSSTNRKFKFTLSGNYLVGATHLQQTDLAAISGILPPDAPPIFNSNGTLNWAHNASGFPSWPQSRNPISFTMQKFNISTNNLVSNAT